MRGYAVTLLLAVALGSGLIGADAKEGKKADAERVAHLIEQLGSDNFGEREAASKALEEIGPDAMEALKKALASPDAEVQRRAKDLVRKIARRVDADKVLAPTRLRLTLDNKPVAEAVVELTKKSGYSIVLAGDQTKLKDRRVTLDTGDATFWQALDQLCQKAELVEWDGQSPLPPAPPPSPAKPVSLPPPNGAAGKAQPIPLPLVPVAPPQREEMMKDMGNMKAPGIPRAAPQGPQGDVILVDGKPAVMPTCYVGALRLRVLPVDSPLAAPYRGNQDRGMVDKTVAVLEVRIEPKVIWQQTQGLRITKAVDEASQALSQVAAEPVPGLIPNEIMLRRREMPAFILPPPGRQIIPVRLQRGEKPSKTLKELAGVLSAQVQSPMEAMITVDNVLKSAGQTFHTADGDAADTLTVQKIDRLPNNQYKVEVHLDSKDPNPGLENKDKKIQQDMEMPEYQPAMLVGRLLNGTAQVSLVDAKGQPLQLVGAETRLSKRNDPRGGAFLTYVLTFQAANAQGEPAKLVCSARRTLTIDVPFTLENVPLP